MNTKIFTAFHEISPSTMAIISSRDEQGTPITYILDEDAEYISQKTPTKIIDTACRYFGSSLKGRQEGSTSISGLTHKVPISIDPASGMYFFPTYSPISPKCSWINHSHVDDAGKEPNNNAEIRFKNGKTIILDVSHGSILNQIHRTAQFRFKLEERMKLIKAEMVAEQMPPFNQVTDELLHPRSSHDGS